MKMKSIPSIFSIVSWMLLMTCFITYQQPLWAMPACQKPIPVSLPDGSTLMVKLMGDEHHSWITTPDGYLIGRNAEGYFEYVSEFRSGKAVLSGVKVNNEAVRTVKEKIFLKQIEPGLVPPFISQPSSTIDKGENVSKGSYQASSSWRMDIGQRFADQYHFQGILVPVNFPDVRLTYSQDAIDSVMNFPGYNGNGAKGSVYDYFQDMSRGKFHFHVKVLPPYTALKDHDAYFDKADDLKSEVYQYVIQQLGDGWYTYDLNADGHIDHISILFAGYGKENTAKEGTIWSHNGYTNYDGYGYACVNISCVAELDNFNGIQGIETYCHEFGHALGLPDYYSTQGGVSPAGLPAQHALMSANTVSGHPVPMSAVSRWVLGWSSFKTLSSQSPGVYVLPDMLETEAAYRFYTPTSGEFFVLENRSKADVWQDRPDLGEGLLIFRVDSSMYVEKVDDNRVNSMDHGAVTLMRADNDESYGSYEGDYFGSAYTSFTDDTKPSSRSLSGLATGLPLTEISKVGNDIRFQFVSASATSIPVHTGTCRWVEDKTYEVGGGYLLPEGTGCAESGICYSLLPNPTISGSKVINEGNVPEFRLFLDLASYDAGAVVNVRAYAKDDAGQVFYGSVRKIEVGADEPLAVDSYFAATVNNKGMDRVYNDLSGIGSLHVRKLDISALEQPMLETPFYYSGWGDARLDKVGYVMISTDEGASWQRLDATGIHAVDEYQFRCMYPLPKGVENLMIKVIGDRNVGGTYDSVIVREGSPYVYMEAWNPVVYVPSSPLGNYHDYTLDTFQRAWLPSYQIYTFNTSDMDLPALRFQFSGEEGVFYIRTDTGIFEMVTPVNICGKLPYEMGRITKAGKVVEDDYTLMPLSTVTLPHAERVYVMVKPNAAFEWEVFDLGRTSACLHSIRSLDNASVEISYSRAIDVDDMDSHYATTGICWSQENQPSLENVVVLPFRSYSVVPVTGLPDGDVYFWTYVLKDGVPLYSEEPLVSRMYKGERENRVKVDSLTAVCPIAWTAEGTAYVVRVVYSQDLLEGAVAQGLCHGWTDNPDINSTAVYHEGDMHGVEYYELTYASTGYGFHIRPFTMTSGGSIGYGRSWKWNPCQMEHPLLSGMVYHAPVDLAAEALREITEDVFGYDYWRGQLSASTYENGKILSISDYAYEDGKVKTPMIDLSGTSHPVMHLEILDNYEGTDMYWDIWAVGFPDGERTLLASLDGSWKEKDMNLVGLADSIFIEVLPRNAFAKQFSVLSWTIGQQVKPLVTTLLPEAHGDSLYFHGSVAEQEGMEEPDEYGFIYSMMGDPLVAMENGGYDYYKVVSASMEEGSFSSEVEQAYTAYNYVRAYARNSHGISYGECLKVLQCGIYEVSATSLPVIDPLMVDVYTVDNRRDVLSVACDDCYPSSSPSDLGKMDLTTGHLKLQEPPRVNKIHALLKFYVQVDAGDEARNDPETVVLSRFSFSYATSSGDTYQPLPEGTTYSFIKESILIGGAYNLYFEVEADLPRDFSHFRIVYDRMNQWKLFMEEIQYTESDRVDNYVAVPRLAFLSVEDDRNVVNWSVDDLSGIQSVRIYREGKQLNQWELAAEFSSGLTTALYSFVDPNSQPKTRAYRYSVRSVNSEGEEFSSEIHKSVHLSINKGIGNQWNLLWNAYEGRTVSSIRVYRSPDGSDFSLIDEVNGGNSSYTDVNSPDGDVYYQVEYVFADETVLPASLGGGFMEKRQDISRSNIATNVGNDVGNLLDGNLSDGNVKMFPNPVRDRVWVELPVMVNSAVLLDMDGREIRHLGSFRSAELDMTGLASGVYFLELRKSVEVLRVKLVKL